MTLNVELCLAFLGMSRAYWECAGAALDCLAAEDTTDPLLRQARCLLVEARDIVGTERACAALRSSAGAHRHMALPALLGSSLPAALDKLRREGVSSDILKDTFQDFARWAEHYERTSGAWGAGELPWLLYPYAGRVLKLGRLMYETCEFPFQYCIYAVPGEARPIVLPAEEAPPHGAETVLAPGFPALNIHIPADGSLRPEQLDDSLMRAKEFYGRRGYPNRVGVCESWLLDPALASFLPRKGNIVRFMERFVKFPLPAPHSSAGDYVFGPGFTGSALGNAPEDTGVQRGLKSFSMSGGVVQDAAGVLWL